jgi:3-phosphoshikimate 1-carboxyvinyltransferase
MSFAVAGLIAGDSIRLNDCSNVATSFPGFLELANSCGFALIAAN